MPGRLIVSALEVGTHFEFKLSITAWQACIRRPGWPDKLRDEGGWRDLAALEWAGAGL